MKYSASQVAGLLSIAVIALAIGFVMGLQIGLVTLLVLPIGIFVVSKPRFLFFVYMVWISTVSTLFLLIHPPQIVKFADELMILLIFGLVLANVAIKSSQSKASPIYRTMAVLLFFVYFISFFVNSAQPMNAALFGITYLRPFIIVAFVWIFYSEKDVPGMIKYALWLFIIQILLNFVWVSRIWITLPNTSYYDLAVGSLGTSTVVAYFTVAVAFYCIAIVARVNKPRQRIHASAIGGLAMIQLYFTYVRHSYLLAVGAGVTLLAISARYWKYLIILALVGSIMLLGISQMEKNELGKSTLQSLQLRQLNERWEVAKKVAKVRLYRSLFIEGIPEMETSLLGAGPGMMGSTTAIMARTPLAIKYLGSAFLTYDRLESSATSSVIGSPFSGIIAIMSDLGWIGLILYWGLHVYVLGAVFCFVRKGKHNGFIRPALFEAFVPYMTFYIMLNVVMDMATFKFISVGVWIWAAVLLDYMRPAAQKAYKPPIRSLHPEESQKRLSAVSNSFHTRG